MASGLNSLQCLVSELSLYCTHGLDGKERSAEERAFNEQSCGWASRRFGAGPRNPTRASVVVSNR